MAYSIDLPAAARRHLQAAEVLCHDKARPDVAGYLFGIAAECAIKVMMRDAGLRPLRADQRRDDPYYAHFPELRTMLRDSATGRGAKPLGDFIASDSFMNNWSTQMRYAPASDIESHWIKAWAADAKRAVDAMGT